VIVALVDVGYSLDQVVNGFVFGEAAAAIGVDRSGETSTGLSLDGAAVAACFTLRDSTGQVIVPDGAGGNALLASATCGRAIRAGTISFDGIDRLRADTETDDSTPDASAETADGEDSAQDAGDAYRLTVVLDSSEEGVRCVTTGRGHSGSMTPAPSPERDA
jgi:hypothetical protein